MDTLAKADIFFFITAIAVVVVGVLLAVALVYIIKILKDFKGISTNVKEETDLLKQDIADLRDNVREEGAKIKHFSSFFGKIYKRNRKHKK